MMRDGSLGAVLLSSSHTCGMSSGSGVAEGLWGDTVPSVTSRVTGEPAQCRLRNPLGQTHLHLGADRFGWCQSSPVTSSCRAAPATLGCDKDLSDWSLLVPATPHEEFLVL